MLPWEGAALLAVPFLQACPSFPPSASDAVGKVSPHPHWCSSCCAVSGQAGKIFAATRVSHPLHVVLLAPSPWAQETGLGTFSGTWHRVTPVRIIIPSYPAPKVGMALGLGPVWERGHCTQELPGTLTAWWHRQPRSRAWEGSLAVSQLTDIDKASSAGQQPCLRLPHPTCPVFCLYSQGRQRHL